MKHRFETDNELLKEVLKIGRRAMLFATDHVLVNMVRYINENNAGFNITLSVNGTIISGTLISKDEYQELLNKELESVVVNKNQNIVDDKTKEKHGNESKSNVVEEYWEITDNLQDLFYHMKDAKIYAQGRTPLIGKLWRGKISSVDGHFWGEQQEK